MVKSMSAVVQRNTELTVEERNLLSVAYKNVIGAHRTSWRVVSSIEQKEEMKHNVRHLSLLKTFRLKIEADIKATCDELIHILDTYLIPNSRSPDAQVFYFKMKGDYYRYLTEYMEGDEKNKAAVSAHESYAKAMEIAQKELPPTSPIRLGLALNFSVFYFEILDKFDQACSVAKKAFDDAVGELDTVSEESYKDAVLVLDLIRDNLKLWTSSTEVKEEEEEEEKQ